MATRRSSVSTLVGVLARLLVAVTCLWPGRATAASASAGLDIEVEQREAVSRLCPGEARRVPLTLHNVGETTWDPARGDRIAYHWRHEDGSVAVRDGERTPLPGIVTPEQTVELRARLVAPDEPGTYRLQWALVREQVRWVDTEVEDGGLVEVRGDGPALRWSRVGGGVPPTLRAGEEVDVELTVRNEGCAAWSPAHGDAMAYHWYDRDGRVVVDEGQRTPLPAVEPGASAELVAHLQAPARAGAHALAWHPVREGLAWFPDGDAMVFVDVVGASSWAWSLQMVEPLVQLPAGDVAEVSVWLRNDGDQEWSTAEGDSLSYRWYDEDGRMAGEGPRFRLPSPWLPGDSEVLDAQVIAPTEPGHYRLVWEPVREGVRWFGASTQLGAELEIEVSRPRLSWAVDEVARPGARWARRTGSLRVVVRNTGAEAWSPELGDRLSYRWRSVDGERAAGDGVRTPLPGPVEPGESVELQARIRGPDEPGRYVLELEMVREHVRWYGSPTKGEARLSVRVERLSSYWVVLVGIAGVLAVFVLRRPGSDHPWRWLLWRAGPAVWVALATGVLVHCFVDLSGAEPWEGSELAVLGPAALLGLVLLPLPPRAQAVLGTLVLTLLTLMALADLAYLHFFGSIVPLTAVLAVHHLVDAEATVGSLLQPAYGWLLALAPLALAVAVAWPRGPVAEAPARPRRALAWVALALAVGSAPFGLALGRIFDSGVGQRVFSEQDNVGRLGVVGAHLFQLMRGVRALFGPRDLTDDERAELAEVLASRRDARSRAAERAPGFGAASGYDVVLIQVEALQEWVIGARVQGQAITPFLEEAAERALYFDQVFDQTAQGRTSDAEYLVLSGGHPPDRGALAFRFQDNDFHTIAHVLAERGYATSSAHPYERGFWNRARLHPRYGFDESRFRRELGPGPSIGWGLTDGAFFERMAPVMQRAPQPSFTFLITLSLHHPYEHFPDAFKRLELGPLEGRPVGNYLHAMHHFDESLAGLMEELRRSGRLERTLVVIYGDHVTGLGEPPEVLALAGRTTWDPGAHVALHRVPVLAWVGEHPPSDLVGRRSSVGGHVDIGATVLHLLGIDDPRAASLGRPLLDPRPGFAALSDGGAVDAELAFAMSGEGIPRGGTCFERSSGRSVPHESCRALADRALVELDAARRILEHDLHRSIPQ